LIEMMATLAICGIIGVGATMANAQVITQTVKNNDYTTANRQVLNAMRWISHDAAMADTIENWENFPASDNLTLHWVTWDNLTVDVVYSVDSEHELRRTITVEGSAPQVNLIAQYVDIDPASSHCNWDTNTGELILTLTGRVGEGAHAVSVTRLNTTAIRSKL
jgi:hypothetical protein